ncbi:MAG: hypothetical protein H7Z14_04580 [Anaerolineae bacterium]|nr:hypothetical protein [Phycisphaerae bacterium]
MMRLNKFVRTALLSATTLAGTFALPAIASAAEGGRFHDARAQDRSRTSDRDDRYRDDHRYDDRRRDDDGGNRNKTDVRIDINLGRPRYEPLYEERTSRVWVEPVYRTVCDRVWVEAVYRTECDRVWEPDRWTVRDVVYREHGRKVIRQERVLVERGHWRDVERQVLVCEGHWQNVDRQELVREGHWEYRTERVQVGEAPVYSNPVVGLFARLTR